MIDWAQNCSPQVVFTSNNGMNRILSRMNCNHSFPDLEMAIFAFITPLPQAWA
jgi:hypothetical protein